LWGETLLFYFAQMNQTSEDKSFLELFISSSSDIPLPPPKRQRREININQPKRCGGCNKRTLDAHPFNSCENCNAHICKKCIKDKSVLCYNKRHIICNRCARGPECNCERNITCPVCAPTCNIDGCINDVLCVNCMGGGMCKLCPNSTGCMEHAICGLCDGCHMSMNYCPSCIERLIKKRQIIRCKCEEEMLCVQCTTKFRKEMPRKHFKCSSCEN